MSGGSEIHVGRFRPFGDIGVEAMNAEASAEREPPKGRARLARDGRPRAGCALEQIVASAGRCRGRSSTSKTGSALPQRDLPPRRRRD